VKFTVVILLLITRNDHGWKSTETFRFRNIKYYAKGRAWLTTTIFTKFLRVLSALTCVKGRKICYWQTVCCSYARCIISVGSTICLCMTSGFCHNVNYICALLDITQCWLVAQNWS